MARVALDSNLLLLFVVGFVARDHIHKHKRLQQFSGAEFDLLASIIRGADTILTTPNVLTEVSNLLVYGVNEPLRSMLRQGLSELIAKSMIEEYQPSRTVSSEAEFSRLGLADCAWLGCIGTETVLLTDDVELFNAASSRGLTVYNFTHLRIESGLLPS